MDWLYGRCGHGRPTAQRLHGVPAASRVRDRGDLPSEHREVRINSIDNHDLIRKSAPLPKGGDKYETATRLTPGFYNCAVAKESGDEGCFSWWFTLYLRTGQSLSVKFRSPASGGLAVAAVFGTNGQPEKSEGDGPDTMRGNAAAGGTIRQVDLVAPASGWYFLRIVADPGTIYRVKVR